MLNPTQGDELTLRRGSLGCHEIQPPTIPTSCIPFENGESIVTSLQLFKKIGHNKLKIFFLPFIVTIANQSR
jgi:hypothetical protein